MPCLQRLRLGVTLGAIAPFAFANRGICSEQYLSVCEKNGHKFGSRPCLGDRLDIGNSYLLDAVRTVGKVAFMLTHTLWRKVLPQDKQSASKKKPQQSKRLDTSNTAAPRISKKSGK